MSTTKLYTNIKKNTEESIMSNQDLRALAAFEEMIRSQPVRGINPEYFLTKLESVDQANPEFLDKAVDAEWQIFLAGWNARQSECEKLKAQVDLLSESWAGAIKDCVDFEFKLEKLQSIIDWLLGRLRIVRQTPNQDIWQTVSFAAPHWNCAEKGPHDMREIVAQAMEE